MQFYQVINIFITNPIHWIFNNIFLIAFICLVIYMYFKRKKFMKFVKNIFNEENKTNGI